MWVDLRGSSCDENGYWHEKMSGTIGREEYVQGWHQFDVNQL